MVWSIASAVTSRHPDERPQGDLREARMEVVCDV
jgi:hypothetical protein